MCWPILYTPAIQWWPKYAMQLVCFAFCALPAYNLFPVVKATVLIYFLCLVHRQTVPEKQYEEAWSYRMVFTKHTLTFYAWLSTSHWLLEGSLAQDIAPTVGRNTSSLIYVITYTLVFSFTEMWFFHSPAAQNGVRTFVYSKPRQKRCCCGGYGDWFRFLSRKVL